MMELSKKEIQIQLSAKDWMEIFKGLPPCHNPVISGRFTKVSYFKPPISRDEKFSQIVFLFENKLTHIGWEWFLRRIETNRGQIIIYFYE